MSCDQVCSAGSRLIVQESIAECMVGKIKDRLKHFRIGDSLDKVCPYSNVQAIIITTHSSLFSPLPHPPLPSLLSPPPPSSPPPSSPPLPSPMQCVDMGAIVHQSQRSTIERYVQQAKEEGAEVYQACATIPVGKGCFYPPTLITKVQPVSTCVQEEVGSIWNSARGLTVTCF